MKKILNVLLCTSMIFGTSACANNENSSSETIISSAKDELTKDKLSIANFDWKVEKILYEGERGYAFSMNNNSPYDLLGVEIKYSLKEDGDTSLFKDFLEEYKDYIDEDDALMLRGEKEVLIKSGDSIDTVGIAIGAGSYSWYDIPSDEQFNAMQPDYLALGIIYNDNVYVCYYDLINENWSVKKGIEVNQWSENKLSALIDKPDAIFSSDYYENINSLEVNIYGVNEDYFNTYKENVIKKGFDVDPSQFDGYYGAEDKDGNKISMYYYSSGNMEISIYGADDDE